MKVFLGGHESRSMVFETLTSLDSTVGKITEVVGCFNSTAIHYAARWAKENKVKVCIHFTDLEDEMSPVELAMFNVEVIMVEQPKIVIMYREQEDIADFITEKAGDCTYVDYILRKQNEGNSMRG